MSRLPAAHLTAYYDLALNIATEYHGKQVDKAGKPYILHPIRVAQMVMIERRRFRDVTDSAILAPAALLHDVIEDTPCTLAELYRRGVGIDTVEIVNLLTRRESDTHNEYIDKICSSGNTGAVLVKWWDIADNTKAWREELLKPEQRMANSKRYEQARDKLAGALTALRDFATT